MSMVGIVQAILLTSAAWLIILAFSVVWFRNLDFRLAKYSIEAFCMLGIVFGVLGLWYPFIFDLMS